MVIKDLFLEDDQGEDQYILSTDWLVDYTVYLNKKSSFFETGKQIKPINNQKLLNGKSEFLPNLILNTHFIVVNKYIWEFLVSLYSGGPCIRRKENGKISVEKNSMKRRYEEKKLDKGKKFNKKKTEKSDCWTNK